MILSIFKATWRYIFMIILCISSAPSSLFIIYKWREMVGSLSRVCIISNPCGSWSIQSPKTQTEVSLMPNDGSGWLMGDTSPSISDFLKLVLMERPRCHWPYTLQNVNVVEWVIHQYLFTRKHQLALKQNNLIFRYVSVLASTSLPNEESIRRDHLLIHSCHAHRQRQLWVSSHLHGRPPE